MDENGEHGAHRPVSPRQGHVSERIPGGSTDESGNEDDNPIPIGDFNKSTSWLVDDMDADRDPDRIKCASELPITHTWNLRTTMTNSEHRKFKEFIDAMFHQLSIALHYIHQSHCLYESGSRNGRQHRKMLRQSWSFGY
jgi:hypothetical protein